MPAKTNAHHIVNLALVPIRRAPDANHSRQLRLFFAHACLQPQMRLRLHAVKLVNDRPARVFAVVIDTRNIEQHVEAKRLFRELADLCDTLGIRHDQSRLAAKLRRFGKQIAEPGFELIGEIERGHRGSSYEFRVSSCFTLRRMPSADSCPTLFCTLISASSNASGRGGHPAT